MKQMEREKREKIASQLRATVCHKDPTQIAYTHPHMQCLHVYQRDSQIWLHLLGLFYFMFLTLRDNFVQG